MNVVADAALLGTNSDGVIVLARAGVSSAHALTFMMEQLRTVDVPVVGAVLNDVDLARDASYDGAYRYQEYAAAYSAQGI